MPEKDTYRRFEIHSSILWPWPRPAVSRCGRPRRGGGGGPSWPVKHQHGRTSSRCGVQSLDIEPPGEGQKTTKYLQMHAQMCHVPNVPFYCTEGHEIWVLRTCIGGLSHCARIFRVQWTVCSEIERKRPNRPGCGQPALAWDGDKVDFPCASGGEGPVLQLLSALGLNVSSSTNRTMYDFVTKLALLSRMLGSVWCAICPYSSRIITGSASKAKKGAEFYKTNISKKGRR